MSIDWFTVVAQVINFIVLVWLMKRFLYAPVLRAIDAREKRIADELAAAADTQREAQAEHMLFTEKNRAFDAERKEHLRAAVEEATAERRRLMDKAHADAEVVQSQSLALLNKKAQLLAETITHRVQHEAFALAEHTLRDVASSGLEAQIVDVFAIKVQALDKDAQQTISRALKNEGGRAVVRSAFPLPVAQQRVIETALDEVMSSKATIEWATDSALLGGIELVVGGHTVSWTLAAHLAALEAGMATAWSTSATAATSLSSSPPQLSQGEVSS